MWKCDGIIGLARSTWVRSLEFWFPRTCLACGVHLTDQRLGFTCQHCRQGIPWIREPMCVVCGKPYVGSVSVPGPCTTCREQAPRFETCRSLFLHRGTGARLVHTLKYEGGTWLEAEIEAMMREQGAWQAYFRKAILVPVPLHARRQRRRGYNQAEVIARGVRRAIPETSVLPILRRTRRTPTQTFLSREARRKNMAGAFEATQQGVPGQRVIIIDDVMTTGATLDAVAGCLAGAGWDRISAFTLAHG